MNHPSVSSSSVTRFSVVELSASAPAPAAAPPPALTTLDALLADRRFQRSLRASVARRVDDPAHAKILLAYSLRLAFVASEPPAELGACKAWVRALVRRQVDNYAWTGLPLVDPGLTAMPTRSRAPSLRAQATAAFEDAQDRHAGW